MTPDSDPADATGPALALVRPLSGAMPPALGVVIVTFNAADVILDCLESLLAATGIRLDIIVVDNASTDATTARIRDWAAGITPYLPPQDMPFALCPAPKPVALQGAVPHVVPHVVPRVDPQFDPAQIAITLIETGVNGGFAAGVNIGLAHLATQSAIDRFWVLNPDSAVPPGTPLAFATEPGPKAGFALMGGRVIYYDQPDMIQIDGGLLNPRTGVTGNIALGQSHAATPPASAAALEFITGASMVVSRAFYDRAGPMAEDYFLYYEEVDWALKRGNLPLAYCPGGIVYHRAGTAIGSPTLGRPASAFSLYFKHRARIMFMRRHRARNLPFALAYSLAKAAQLALRGYWTEARTIVQASLGLPPPRQVRARLSPEAAERAFGSAKRR